MVMKLQRPNQFRIGSKPTVTNNQQYNVLEKEADINTDRRSTSAGHRENF
jgi:hypothetical protein